MSLLLLAIAVAVAVAAAAADIVVVMHLQFLIRLTIVHMLVSHTQPVKNKTVFFSSVFVLCEYEIFGCQQNTIAKHTIPLKSHFLSFCQLQLTVCRLCRLHYMKYEYII